VNFIKRRGAKVEEVSCSFNLYTHLQTHHPKDKRVVSTQESASESQWYWSKQGSDERNGPVSLKWLEELV
jgi:hypothetical protein